MFKRSSTIVVLLAGLLLPVLPGVATSTASVNLAQSRGRTDSRVAQQAAPAQPAPNNGCNLAPCFMDQIRSRMKCYELPPAGCGNCKKPGLAVAIIMNDKVIFKDVSGHANIDAKPQPVLITKDTVFDLASLTKQFTAAGILMLMDDRSVTVKNKRLTVDTLLVDIMDCPTYAQHNTIGDLLTHQSNLRDYLSLFEDANPGTFLPIKRGGRVVKPAATERRGPPFWYEMMDHREPRREETNETLLDKINRAGQENREPGSDFIYSNSGYVVLAQIIEKLSGKTYKQFMQERIFGPLNMNNTFVFDEKSPKIPNHAFGYGRDSNGYFAFDGYTPLNFIHGDGNIHSTLADMIKWAKAVDDVAHGRRETFIKRQTLITASRFKRLRNDLRKRLHYGFGYYIADTPTVNVIYHAGDWPGFHSYMLYGRMAKPGEAFCEITIIVLSNFEPNKNDKSQNRPCHLARQLSKVFWGETEERNIILDEDKMFCGSSPLPKTICRDLPKCNSIN